MTQLSKVEGKPKNRWRARLPRPLLAYRPRSPPHLRPVSHVIFTTFPAYCEHIHTYICMCLLSAHLFTYTHIRTYPFR